jgi:hypothetical protein
MVEAYFTECAGHFLEEVMKTTKNLDKAHF